MDTETIPFSYKIAGLVNGEQAALRIEGSVERGRVRFDVEDTSERDPLLWDPTVIALAAIDPVLLMSLDPGALRTGSAPEVFRIETGLYDDGEQAAGCLVLSGYVRMGDGRIEVRAQIVEGWLSFEPLERVTQVGESMSMGVLPTDSGRAVATRAWSIETNRGDSYEGVSVARGCRVASGEDAGGRMHRIQWSECVHDGTSGRSRSIACRVTVANSAAT